MPDAELAQTFFNSVTRRIFSTVGVDPGIEYLESTPLPPDADAERAMVAEWTGPVIDAAMIRSLLESYEWSVPYAQIAGDAERVARLIADRVTQDGEQGALRIEMLRPAFYRNKGAYLVGRIRQGDRVLPLVLPLLNASRGIVVDSVLLTENEASVVFGFSWSYFRVDVPHPRVMVDFLSSIMPYKRVDELYTAIGYNKHGKTELFRNLMRRLEEPDARFAFAEGDEGMVMAVFTLPAFNAVFKIIKDSFGAPKNTTRQAVMDKYHFVFVRDRVGRLADAQEFEHLDFPRRCFPDDLLEYLLAVAVEVGPAGGRSRGGPPRLHGTPGDAPQPLSPRRGAGRGTRRRDRLRQRHQGPRRRRHFHRRHAAQELRRDPQRPGDLLRLR